MLYGLGYHRIKYWKSFSSVVLNQSVKLKIRKKFSLDCETVGFFFKLNSNSVATYLLSAACLHGPPQSIVSAELITSHKLSLSAEEDHV